MYDVDDTIYDMSGSATGSSVAFITENTMYYTTLSRLVYFRAMLFSYRNPMNVTLAEMLGLPG